jgi:hypothetical protein
MEVFAVNKVILGVLMLSVAMAGQAFAGGFSQTCKEIHLDGSHLQAKCKAETGAYGDTSTLKLSDYIGSTNGALVWNSSNFKEACQNWAFQQTSYNDALLLASCKNNTGEYVHTQINLNERISNINSHLRYDN